MRFPATPRFETGGNDKPPDESRIPHGTGNSPDHPGQHGRTAPNHALPTAGEKQPAFRNSQHEPDRSNGNRTPWAGTECTDCIESKAQTGTNDRHHRSGEDPAAKVSQDGAHNSRRLSPQPLQAAEEIREQLLLAGDDAVETPDVP